MYTAIRNVVRFLLDRYHDVEVIGLENIESIPDDEGFIVVANHQAVVDSFLLPAFILRQFAFLSKKEYFEKRGIRGWILKWILSHGAIPVDRSDPKSGADVLGVLADKLRTGHVAVGFHPEGTRAPTQAVYRAKPGVAELAWASGVKVVPVAILGSRRANPPGRHWPRLGSKITLVIGEPMVLEPKGIWPALLEGSADNRQLLGVAMLLRRSELEVQARRVMMRIAELARTVEPDGWPYIDLDASVVKKQIAKAAKAKDE